MADPCGLTDAAGLTPHGLQRQKNPASWNFVEIKPIGASPGIRRLFPSGGKKSR